MILFGLLQLFFGVVAFIIGLIPDVVMPDWLADVTALWAESMDAIYAFHNVVPLTAISNAAVFLFACTLICAHLRMVRMAMLIGTGKPGSSVAS